MTKFGVNITLRDLYYEVEALDQDEAIQMAMDLAFDDVGNLWDLDPDCNECIEFDDEDEGEDD